MMAGAFIALGAVASNVAMHQIANVGVARFVAGAIFPVGLMLIIIVGGELFTGDCLVLMGVYDKKVHIGQLVKLLLIVFLANFAGAICISLLVSLSGQWDYSGGALGAFTYRLAVTKSQMSVTAALCSGILCNLMVCSAVLMALSCKSAPGKIFSVFFTIMGFVVSGFEHCVANMYYLTAGFLAGMNPSYLSKASELYGQLPELTVKNMLLGNLLWVTIGNIIGGFIIATLIYLVKENRN